MLFIIYYLLFIIIYSIFYQIKIEINNYWWSYIQIYIYIEDKHIYTCHQLTTQLTTQLITPINMKKQTLITDYFSTKPSISTKKRKIVYGYNEETDSWHCMECGEDMGSCNPRQLCGKTYCVNKFY